MARTRISEFSATAADNTDIDSIDIAEGCAPSGINNAIRELMAQLKDFQTGAGGDSFTTANLAYTGTLTGGTGVINIGSGQLVKDASGNLGLGVTPSAWLSSIKAMQIGGNGALYGNNSAGNNTSLVSNAYIDSSSTFRYLTNGYATGYQQFDSSHIWRIAPLGTAGNTISFTQAMTLSAAGNLGIGVSPDADAKLQVEGGIRATSGSPAAFNMTNGFSFKDSKDAGMFSPANGVVGFATAGTERARIDSSGNLLVGTTATNPVASRVNGTVFLAGGGMRLRSVTAESYFGLNVSSGTHMSFYTDNGSTFTTAGNISSNGGTTSYNGSSDYRLKDNIEPLSNALETISKLKPCTFTWKIDGRSDNGFIAHELQEVLPNAVTGEKDAVNADGSIKAQGVDPRNIVATVVAALQELKAEFDAYKAAHP